MLKNKKMKTNNDLKTRVKITAALCIILFGGITIWSCSQDDLLEENGQPIYRYTEEEIATLKTLAEEYGIPDVVFDTSSKTKLLSIKEMEEIFKEMGAIKYSISAPMTVQDSTEQIITYVTQKPSTPRIRKKTASSGETSYSFSVFADRQTMTLTFHVRWFRDENNQRSIQVSGGLNPPSGYDVREEVISYPASPKSSNVSISYRCILYHTGAFGQTISTPLSCTQNITLPI